MCINSRKAFPALAGLALALSASGAWAQASNQCVTVPSGTPDTTIVVASNFYGPAQSLVADFTAVGAPGAGKRIEICHNSTGLLYNQIVAAGVGSSPYSALFAANASTPDTLAAAGYSTTGTNDDFYYAGGIPVLFSDDDPAFSDPLLTGGGLVNTSSYPLIGVAAPNLAPYGNAAFLVMDDMGMLSYTPYTPPSPLPGWIHSPLYDNISLTYNAVFDNDVDAAFVSKAQICDQLGDVTWVEFTDPAFIIAQNAILLEMDSNHSNSTAQETLAASLKSFFMNNSAPSYYHSTFLSDNCYQ